MDMNRLFDDKVAISAAYQYDGEKQGEAWKRKIRAYWILKAPTRCRCSGFSRDFSGQPAAAKHHSCALEPFLSAAFQPPSACVLRFGKASLGPWVAAAGRRWTT